MTILGFLLDVRRIKPHDRTPAIYDKDLDELIRQAKTEEKKTNGCSWCEEFGSIPLRAFTPHGCISRTVHYCPMCGKQLIADQE